MIQQKKRQLSRIKVNNRFSLPWNQSTYIGNFAEVIAAVAIAEAYNITNHPILLLFISICIYHMTFFKMFVHLIEKLDRCRRVRRTKQTILEIIHFRTAVQK